MRADHLIARGKNYAQTHYNDNMGWSVMVECWDDAHWKMVVDGFTSWDAFKEHLATIADIHHENYLIQTQT